MTEKYLIVKGCAGLGNRISTICSAIEYAKTTHRTMLVDWGDGGIVQEGYNFFYDYFFLRDVDHVLSYDSILNQEKLSFYPDVKRCDITSSTYQLFESNVSKLLGQLPFHRLPKNKIRTYHRHWRVRGNKQDVKLRNYFLLLDNRVIPYGGDMSRKIKEDVVFFMDYVPSFSDKTVRKHLCLKKKMQTRINQFLVEKLDGGKAIGVHIRATDKQPDSEIKDLVGQIKSLGGKELQVFLSTDNADIQCELNQVFSSIIFYPKCLPKILDGGLHQWFVNNMDHKKAVESLESSIADMYLLSACEYLFYQGNSSFSRIAALMHGNDSKATDWNVSSN